MSKVSVRVENQMQNGNHIVSSVAVHGERVAKLLGDALPGMEEGRIVEMLRAFSDSLARATTALGNRESAYVAEQADDDAPRNLRDQAFADGQAALSSAGHRLQSIPHQDDLRKKYGIPTVAPGTPDQLLTVLKNAATLLGNAPGKHKDPFGQEVDPKMLGAYLSGCAAPLEQALQQVTTEKRELQEALLERDRALEHWGEVYQSVASVLEGSYRLAGLQELADRIRPTLRRRRGEAAPEQPINDPNLSNPTDSPAPTVPA